MKFGDKLIELRKRKGYSQEELAEKLGVSRQSVSKWESNNTYPETDKIIQIANIFECSMDDLINDKITDVESTYRKNKNNIYNVWDSLLEFITKTINMFSKMRFIDGLKCLIELSLLGLILTLLGHIICGTASSIIANIFSFLSREHISTLREILMSVFRLIWFVISMITMVHTFKLRYLNYYDSKDTESKNEESSTKESNDDKNEKIIVRDEKPFEFLGVLAKIVIIFMKFIAVWVLLTAIVVAISLVVGSVIAISFIFTNIVFLWISLLLIAGVTFSIQVIVMLICFIFNKNINWKVNILVFIGCILLSGIGVGLTTLSLKNMDYVDDNSIWKLETKELNIQYKDDLVIKSHNYGMSDQYKYVIDDSFEDNQIIVSREIDPRYSKLTTSEVTIDNLPVTVINEKEIANFKDYFKAFTDNLKKNKIISFNNYGTDPLIIRANQTTINNLIENMKKLYLVEEVADGNIITITIKTDKVYFKEGLEGEYYAKDDTLKYNEDNYSCTREIETTAYGDRIIYTCDYTNYE